MKKALDFILIFLLMFFAFNYFYSKKEEEKKTNTIVFKTMQDTYQVPAGVNLLIENNTSAEFKINTCDNIILKDPEGKTISVSKNICKNLIIQPNLSESIDYSQEFEKLKVKGTYIFEMNVGDKKQISQFEIEYRGFIGKLFVGLIYAPIYNLMVVFLNLFSYSLGWAIISITILVRLVLLWPQHKMLLSQKKLQAIQPKIKKIQDEHKGDQQKMGEKLMELYKKEKVNPLGSCGFMLIQMPILLVMYRIILNIKDPSNIFYIYKMFEDFDISKISYSFVGIDLTSKGGITGIAIALFIGIIQFLQIKLSLNLKKKDTNIEVTNIILEKKKGKDDYSNMMPDPNAMNKFMLYGMPVMVSIFTYNLFAGVGLYWGISTIFAIFQQLIVNKVLNKSS